MLNNIPIDVTEEDLAKACIKDKHRCMISIALKRKLTKMKIQFSQVSTDLGTIRFTDMAEGIRYCYVNPSSGQRGLAKFDKGAKIEPFRFIISSPITGPMKKFHKNYKEPVRIDNSKRGRKPSVHGVKRMPPKTDIPTLHSAHRKYGLDSLRKYWGEE